jgi:hypothetical protein
MWGLHCSNLDWVFGYPKIFVVFLDPSVSAGYRDSASTVSTSETSVSFYQTTRRNIPEDSHVHAFTDAITKYFNFDSSTNSNVPC